MKIRIYCSVFAMILSLAFVDVTKADYLMYHPPNLDIPILLPGRVTVNAGRTVTLSHPKYGNLYFSLDNVEIYDKVPSIPDKARGKIKNAVNKKDAVAAFAAAYWSLKNGQIKVFYEGIDEVLKLDPNHKEARHIKAMKARFENPLGSFVKEEAELTKMVTKKGMKVKTSNHFILLHDTPDKSEDARRKPRADERLELLEQVYETFLLTFYSRGVALEIPEQRMKVVLFNRYNDYLDFSTRLDPDLVSTAGFFAHGPNTSFFFDNSTYDEYKILQKLVAKIQSDADDALRVKDPQAAELQRLAKSLKVAVLISQENQDIEVVSHEATHQLAANTGLLPLHVHIPSWVHEGLATYFESPSDASWAGIGSVNRVRIKYYRALEEDREHSNIDFIVGDEIFDFAASHSAKLHGYGQAWALTHFCMEKHFDQMIKFYRLIGEMPPHVLINHKVLNQLFDRAFQTDRALLDQDWRAHMRDLRTSREILLEGE